MADAGGGSNFSGQPQGRRKSRFPAVTAVPAGAYMDVFNGGVNYKISYSDFVAGLGVTGTIVQAGDPAATPILDTQGTVNNIRNLEPGEGLTAGVSPQNGASLGLNLANTGSGGRVLKDPTGTASDPRNFRTLRGLGGVSVSEGVDTLDISIGSVSTQTVTVTDEGDLPPPVGGVITLAADTEYVFVNDLTTTNRFQTSDRTSVTANSPGTIEITYTGTDPMFTVPTATRARFVNITLTCPNSIVVSSAAGASVSLLLARVEDCVRLGDAVQPSFLYMEATVVTNIQTSGWTITGASSGAFFQTVFCAQTRGAFVTMTGATFDQFSIANCFFDYVAAGGLLVGDAASANINAGRVGSVLNTRLGGAGPVTPLTGITSDDARWEFDLNDLIANTQRRGLVYLAGNATVTTIAASSTPVIVAGTWGLEAVSGYTANATGRITYVSPKPANAIVTLSGSIVKSGGGGGGEEFRLYVAKNGTIIANAFAEITASTGTTANGTVAWNVAMVENDFIEIWVSNESDTDDLVVTTAQMRIES